MIVKINRPEEEKSFSDVLNEFMNKTVFVSWPYLLEAKYVLDFRLEKYVFSKKKKKCSKNTK